MLAYLFIGAPISYGLYFAYLKFCRGAELKVENLFGLFNSKYYNNLPPFLKKDIDLLHEADLNAH